MFADPTFQSQATEIIKDKLYWISAENTPKNLPKTYFFFNIDNDLVYEPLYSDFGPLDISQTVKFVLEVNRLLKCSQFSECKIYHHTSLDPAKRANAAFLMGAFQIITLHRTAEEAWKPFSRIEPAFIAFRDASHGSCDYKCTILDCLKGLESAIRLGWFDLKKFDLKTFEANAKVDVNWIIPGKMLAFSEPFDKPQDSDGYQRFVPEDYVSNFKKLRVKTIVRLSSQNYDKERFTQYGFKHYDLDLSDTWCPNDEQIDQFIKICEKEKGVIAVHCKSGLGHTGTMIACYAMKFHKFPGAGVIGWLRLCRPGSIYGGQQKFLIRKEEELCKRPKSTKAPLQINIDDFEAHTEPVVQQCPYVSKSPKLSPLKTLKVIISKSL